MSINLNSYYFFSLAFTFSDMWIRQFYLILLFTLFWMGSHCSNETEWSTIVDNYISQVAPLAISSSDSLRDMAMLSANASKFANITAAAMKLIMDSIRNNESEPDNSEFEILQKLHNSIIAQFEQIDKLIRAKEQTIGDSLGKYHYDKVEDPLQGIIAELLWVTDPRLRNSRMHYVKTADELCRGSGTNSPRSILFWLEYQYVRYCRRMSRQQIGLFAAASSAFGPLDQMVENELTTPEQEDYFHDKADYLYRMMMRREDEQYETHKELVESLERRINEIIKSDGQAFKYGIFQLLNTAPYRDSRDVQYFCTLDAVLMRHQFKRDRILDLVELLRLEMIRLMNIIPLCINIQSTHPTYINSFVDELVDRVVEIAKHVHRLSVFYLEESWPGIMINAAKKEARRHALTTPHSWNQTAKEISNALNKLGPDGYNHQVLLTPPWDSVKWFFAELELNDGFIVKKFNDLVNIVVVRYKRDDMQTFNRLKNASEKAANVSQIIIQIIKESQKSDDMAVVLGTINNQTAGLHGPHNFHASILIHNLKWLNAQCQIPTGHSDGYLNDMQTYNYVHYHENGYVKGCQDFKLFHLL